MPARAAVALLALVALLAVDVHPGGADGNEAPNAPAAARSVAAGLNHSCALLDDGTVKCWGRGINGQLGQGTPDDLGDQTGEMADLDPVDLGTDGLGNDLTATAVAAGNFHTCALLDTGAVKCWGAGGSGRLGQDGTDNLGDDPGEMGDDLDPVFLGVGRTATAITAGNSHTCALLDTGDVKCWGNGGFGQLGQDNPAALGDAPGEMANLDPVDLGPGRTATAIAAGSTHTCALLDTGEVTCWGNGEDGRLGQDNPDTLGDQVGEMANLDPVDLGPGRTATAITAGSAHTCAILDTGAATCWGLNNNGQLGQDSTDNLGDQAGEMANLDPVDLGPGRTAAAITAGGGLIAGGAHTCALLDDATVRCWGSGGAGQLGQDSTDTVGDQSGEMATLTPVDLGTGRTATAVTAGAQHTCALLDDATLKCWGSGVVGQLGQDSNFDLGDQPGEMAALAPIALGRLVGVGARARPDAHLRRGTSGPGFVGLDRYNTTGANQTRSASVRRRGTARFTVRVQNDGTYTDRYRVRAKGNTTRYSVTYRRGSNNITTAVRGAGFVTPEIHPGQSLNLTVTIQAKANARRGQRIDRLVTVTSQNDTTRKDAVKARVTRR